MDARDGRRQYDRLHPSGVRHLHRPYDLQTGELLDEFSFEEGTVKGQGRAKGKAPVDCTFSTVFEGFDEEFGQEVRVEFSGEVSVVIRP